VSTAIERLAVLYASNDDSDYADLSSEVAALIRPLREWMEAVEELHTVDRIKLIQRDRETSEKLQRATRAEAALLAALRTAPAGEPQP
jgi:hypothetical protein